MIERAAYPLDEAGRLLGGISRGTFYNMRDRGEIRLVKLGRRTLVPRSEIERLTATERPDDDPEPS
jgi:excisionase family DNA binding protein